ncbi:MAG TPA: ATP-binding protein [Chloroflexota bacterium]
MHTSRTPRLATRLILATLGLLLPLYLILLAGYATALREQRTSEVANSVTVGQMTASVIDGFRRDLNGTVLATTLAFGDRERPLDQDTLGPYLDTLTREYPTLRALFVTDPQGRVIAAQAASGIGADVAGRPYIAALQTGNESVWTGGLAGLQSGQATVAHGRVIRGTDGAVRGFLIAAFQPQAFVDQLPVAVAPDAVLALVDEHGQVVFASDTTSLKTFEDLSGSPMVRQALAGSLVRLDGEQTPFAPGAQYGAVVPVGKSGWVVAYTRPLDALESSLRERLLQQALATTAVMAAAAILIAYLTRRLLRPLRTLVGTASAVARGERARVGPMGGDSDVLELAAAMDEMSRAVAAREDALRDETRLVETLRSVGETLAAELDLARLVQAATDAATEVTGAEFGAFFYNHVDEHGEPSTLHARSGTPPDGFGELPTSPGGMPDGHLSVRSYLAVPVVSRSGAVLGGLSFGHSRAGVFSPRSERLATGVAAQAAIALDNAQLYREAQDAVSARDQFLSIASHELRTPLAAIKATAQAALRAGTRGMLDQERAERSFRTIASTTDHVTRLAADLLDVARLRSGTLPIAHDTIDVGSLIQRVVNGFRDQWEGERELILESHPEQVLVEGDPDRLEQVLGNLLENAAKYSPPTTAVRLVCSADSTGVQVGVVDEGIGVPAGAVDALFQPFSRAPNAVARHIQGLGLGLYIARQVVEAHGGRIWCSSTGDGQGSTFTMWLPRS